MRASVPPPPPPPMLGMSSPPPSKALTRIRGRSMRKRESTTLRSQKLRGTSGSRGGRVKAATTRGASRKGAACAVAPATRTSRISTSSGKR